MFPRAEWKNNVILQHRKFLRLIWSDESTKNLQLRGRGGGGGGEEGGEWITELGPARSGQLSLRSSGNST